MTQLEMVILLYEEERDALIIKEKELSKKVRSASTAEAYRGRDAKLRSLRIKGFNDCVVMNSRIMDINMEINRLTIELIKEGA